jgi:uncharacterized protein YeaC (DUF1315 family)
MIVRFPTALYRSVIPSVPDSPGNVTYTISTTDPPRNNRTAIIIPPAIELKKWPEVILTQDQRRQFLGAQIFTVTKSTVNRASSGMKQHEVGEVLEFSDEDVTTLDPMAVAPALEIRHDTNQFDYGLLGLSESQQETLTAASTTAYRSLVVTLNGLRTQRAAIEADINQNQKQQNEATKVLAAVDTVTANPALIEIRAKLQDTLVSLQDEAALLVARANDLAAQAADASDSLRKIAQVVR